MDLIHFYDGFICLRRHLEIIHCVRIHPSCTSDFIYLKLVHGVQSIHTQPWQKTVTLKHERLVERQGKRQERAMMQQTSGSFWKSVFLFLVRAIFSRNRKQEDKHKPDHSNVEPHKPPPQKKSAPLPSELCKGCKEVIDKVKERYSQKWKKQEENYKKFRAELIAKCHGFDKAIITQANTVVGSKIVYDGEKKRTLRVTPEIHSTFAKEHPFPNKTFDTCAVVGNGGILGNSGCGKKIDSADFVIRCNLPPLQNGYEEHVGVKTDLVTANPSILLQKYGALNGRRRPFVESLSSYGNSMVLLPAFSFGLNTPVSLRAVYTIEDFGSPIRPVFFNPEYLLNVDLFWRSQGLKASRPSTGFIMTSLALELCSEVHLYGFWPFSNHPEGLYSLTNHYYDDVKARSNFHAMPVEFDFLLRLHSEGVLRLHLGDCRPDEK